MQKKYIALNTLAEPNGILIFGGTDDIQLPLCELKQAFSLEEPCYNRSFENLSVKDAAEFYCAYAAELAPQTVLLHIGAADLTLFETSAEDFTRYYRQLIEQIHIHNKHCQIAIVSIKGHNYAELNKHLKYIASSEHCEFCDISGRRLWNPRQTKDVISFVYNTGFIHPLKRSRPLYNLVNIFFGSLAD